MPPHYLTKEENIEKSSEVIQDVNGVIWRITEYPDGWKWVSKDEEGMERESMQSFVTKEACKADAEANGMREANRVAKFGRGHKIEEE